MFLRIGAGARPIRPGRRVARLALAVATAASLLVALPGAAHAYNGGADSGSAVALPCTPPCQFTGDNTGLTNTVASHRYNMTWYSWTAARSGHVTVRISSISPSNWDNVVRVYQGATMLADNDDSYGLDAMTTFTATASTQYLLAMGSYSSGVRGTATVTVSDSPPDTPAAPTGSAGDGQVTVSWSAPNDNYAAITGYTVYAYQGGVQAGSAHTVTGTPPTTSLIVSSLTNGLPYTFKVLATNGNGDSALSDPSDPYTPATTTTTVGNVSPTSIVFGQQVTITATVTPTGAGTPTGTVTLSEGATVLGPTTLSSGTATFHMLALGPGSHTYSVAYGGTAGFGASSDADAGTVVVSQASTTTALTVDRTTREVNQHVQATARVSVVSPGGGDPDGDVRFKDGNTVLADVPVSGGVARATLWWTTPGAHHLTATFRGSTNHATSTSSSRTVTVLPPPVWTTYPVRSSTGIHYAWSRGWVDSTLGRAEWTESTPGATATYRFHGTQITYWYSTGPDHGSASVKIDGRPVGVVDENSSTAQARQHTTFTGLAHGWHTLTVVVRPQDAGELSREVVSVDAFSPTPRCDARCDRDPDLAMNWSRTELDGQGYVFSRRAGSSLRANFLGIGVSVTRVLGHTQGSFAVYIDGVRRAIVNDWADQLSTTSTGSTWTGLAEGLHTLEIRVLERRGASDEPDSRNVSVLAISTLQRPELPS